MTRILRVLPAALLGLGLVAAPRVASANGFEFPSNGTESFGRGSAWLARATDPLATFYNPAALARNGNAASITGNLIWQKACFQRRDGGSDPVANGVLAGNSEQLYRQTCNDGDAFVNPQLALQFRLSEKLGIGVAVMGPSAYGKTSWPTFASNTSLKGSTLGQPVRGPAGSRYLLTAVDNLLVWPQIAIGYEVTRNVRLGASLIWGIASLEFGNVSMGAVSSQTKNPDGRINEASDQDVNARITAKDWFVPGFVLSALVTPVDTATSGVDVAAWFHWSDAVKASGKADLSACVYDKNTLQEYTSVAANTPSRVVTGDNGVTIRAPQPWELRVGGRYYQKRRPADDCLNGVCPEKSRRGLDPLRDEVFDVELDLEYSHDSQFDTLGVTFAQPTPVLRPGITADSPNGIPISIPVDASVRHNWKDSFGVRLGGDFAVVPERFALRAGAWYQSAFVDAKDMHVDFIGAERLALTAGLTARVVQSIPVDIQLGYEHIFFKTLDNKGQGSIHANGTGQSSVPGTPFGRSGYAVNGGKIQAKADILSLGVVVRGP